MNIFKDLFVEMEKFINFLYVVDICLVKGLCYD